MLTDNKGTMLLFGRIGTPKIFWHHCSDVQITLQGIHVFHLSFKYYLKHQYDPRTELFVTCFQGRGCPAGKQQLRPYLMDAHYWFDLCQQVIKYSPFTSLINLPADDKCTAVVSMGESVVLKSAYRREIFQCGHTCWLKLMIECWMFMCW